MTYGSYLSIYDVGTLQDRLICLLQDGYIWGRSLSSCAWRTAGTMDLGVLCARESFIAAVDTARGGLNVCPVSILATDCPAGDERPVAAAAKRRTWSRHPRTTGWRCREGQQSQQAGSRGPIFPPATAPPRGAIEAIA